MIRKPRYSSAAKVKDQVPESWLILTEPTALSCLTWVLAQPVTESFTCWMGVNIIAILLAQFVTSSLKKTHLKCVTSNSSTNMSPILNQKVIGSHIQVAKKDHGKLQ